MKISVNLKLQRLFSTQNIAQSDVLKTTAILNQEEYRSHDKVDSFLYTACTRVPFTVEPHLEYFSNTLNKNKHLMKRTLIERQCSRYSEDGFLDQLSENMQNFIVPNLLQRNLLQNQIYKETNDEALSNLKQELKCIKNNLRNNRSIVLDCLRLPNFIDFQKSNKKQNVSTDYKLNVSEFLLHNNCLEYRDDPCQLFLKNEAAFGLKNLMNFWRQKLHTFGFTLVSPPHMVRSAVVEAVEGEFRGQRFHKIAPNVDSREVNDVRSTN